MTDSTARAPGAAPEAKDVETTAGAPATPEAPEVDPFTALTAEAASLKDKLLRALAEMENLRRRTEREVADARQYGVTGFARDIVGVADNMRRALDAVGADAPAAADPALKAFIEGVELTERELIKALEKQGVKKLDPQGQKFDPNMHQAMYEVPNPSVPANTVAQVIQPGYSIGDRVLRPAMVAVAKGGPKAPPAEPPIANDNAGAQRGK